jgi:protocatechuate 3,4-dioxygenase alpha subunit
MIATPGQTVGPFFHYALPYDGDRDLIAPGAPGAIRLHGTVYDGAGAGVPDALVEIWQADAEGHVVQRQGSLRRDAHTFTGFGRASTDRTGEYTFTTVAPAGIDGGLPFFALTVFARGLLNRLFTRGYLPLATDASDPLLDSLAPDRRMTLMCEPDPQGFRFDIRLMGERETVFLRYPGH